jgi:hypothetical protein
MHRENDQVQLFLSRQLPVAKLTSDRVFMWPVDDQNGPLCGPLMTQMAPNVAR